jgi:hypothetical protein
MPWRIPYEERSLFYPGRLLERAEMPAGVRLSFRSDTESISGEIVTDSEAVSIDLCCDGETLASIGLAGKDQFVFDELPSGEKLIELWLPQFGGFRLRSLRIDEGSELIPFVDDRPRWITYGSSITQCRAADSPTQTWPAIVARGMGLDLTCLGFGGECHLDIMIARTIRDMPADLISMCVGINIQGGSTMSQRTFRPGIIGFVKTIRDKHIGTPIIVMSPIYSPPRETTRNNAGLSLVMMRKEVSAAVEALRERGDQNIHYFDGLDVFGEEHAHLLPDDLHPNAEGYKVMGANFLAKLKALIDDKAQA